MTRIPHAVALAAALLAAQAVHAPLGLAQTTTTPATTPGTTPTTTTPATTPNSPSTPAPELKAPTDTGSPNLVVATVKLDSGWRASKLIGASVYDDANHQIGSVDDLIVEGTDRIAVAIVSVGGFLGIGSKLIAVPYDHLHYDPTSKDAHVMMPGATKDSLNQMPSFTYGNG